MQNIWQVNNTNVGKTEQQVQNELFNDYGTIVYSEEINIFGSELLNIHKSKIPDESRIKCERKY